MGSTVSGLGSFVPSLIDSLTAAPAAATSPVSTYGVSVQQEFSAMRNGGDLNGFLSDSVAIGVMQITYGGTAPSGAAADMSGLVNQLVAAYANPGDSSTSSSTGASAPQQSAATLSTDPSLAIIQTMENMGAFTPAVASTTSSSQFTG